MACSFALQDEVIRNLVHCKGIKPNKQSLLFIWRDNHSHHEGSKLTPTSRHSPQSTNFCTLMLAGCITIQRPLDSLSHKQHWLHTKYSCRSHASIGKRTQQHIDPSSGRMPSNARLELDYEIISSVRNQNLHGFVGTTYRWELLKPTKGLDNLVRGFIRESLGVPLQMSSRTDAEHVRAVETKECECGDNPIRKETDVDEGCCLDEMSTWEVVYITKFLGEKGNRHHLLLRAPGKP